MAFYSVHRREGAPPEEAIFVREGFSLGAFVLTVLWALWHRMWLTAAILLAISGAIALAGNLFHISDGIIALAGFVVNLIFGFEARDLQNRSLIARGYDSAGHSHGRNLAEAEIRYFHTNVERHPSSNVAVPKRAWFPAEADTLGIFGNV
jgi:hypothetical protein